jgi:hypothetical protein
MRDSKRIYQILYKYGPIPEPRMRELLGEEQFKMAWIGAQNSHRKHRIAIVFTAYATSYGLTVKGEKQLSKWEK